jgi:hypothetical protein
MQGIKFSYIYPDPEPAFYFTKIVPAKKINALFIGKMNQIF